MVYCTVIYLASVLCLVFHKKDTPLRNETVTVSAFSLNRYEVPIHWGLPSTAILDLWSRNQGFVNINMGS